MSIIKIVKVKLLCRFTDRDKPTARIILVVSSMEPPGIRIPLEDGAKDGEQGEILVACPTATATANGTWVWNP